MYLVSKRTSLEVYIGSLKINQYMIIVSNKVQVSNNFFYHCDSSILKTEKLEKSLKLLYLCLLWRGTYASRSRCWATFPIQLIINLNLNYGKLLPHHGQLQYYTAKTKDRNFEENIPRKGISGSKSQFPHSCVCERFIYSHDWSAYSAAGNMWTDPGNI